MESGPWSFNPLRPGDAYMYYWTGSSSNLHKPLRDQCTAPLGINFSETVIKISIQNFLSNRCISKWSLQYISKFIEASMY